MQYVHEVHVTLIVLRVPRQIHVAWFQGFNTAKYVLFPVPTAPGPSSSVVSGITAW